MWLARLFGGRTIDDSEPAKFPPRPASSGTTQTTGRPRTTPGVQRSRPVQKIKGFDPYNSGAFRKASAWERVHRR